MGEIRDNVQRNLILYLSISGLSQKEFAKRIGVSQSSVTNWVKGSNSPDIEVVARICDVLGISVVQLFGTATQPQLIQSPNKPLSQAEEGLLEDYRQLNSEGQDKASEYVSDLVATGRYKKHNPVSEGRMA